MPSPLNALLQALGNLGLRLLRAPVTMECLPVEALDAGRIAELHALANALMQEDLAQFTRHVGANEAVHVFRGRSDGQVLGFQFWRRGEDAEAGIEFIMGGKLRMHPSIRRRALHLYSGLLYALGRRLRRPLVPIQRLSIAGLYGFVSISEALANYQLYPLPEGVRDREAIHRAFARMAEFSRFEIRADGRFFVNIYPTAETLAAYPPPYYERPAARVYLGANPEFRSNGCYLGFCFRFDRANLASIIATIRRKNRD